MWRCSRATISFDRGPTSRRLLIGSPSSRKRSSGASVEAQRQVGGDGRRGLFSVEGEARPRIEVEEHEAAIRRRDGVTAIDLEPERARRPPREAREPLGVERIPSQGLILVVEPPEPWRPAVWTAP